MEIRGVKVRVKKTLKFLKDARNCAELSTCLRRQYGAVIVKGDRQVSSGYNGSARGCEHCTELGYCWREKNNVPSGERYEECEAIHAEQNAMYRCDWEVMQGATLFIYGMENGTPIDSRPCKICERHIRTNGIAKVVCGNKDGSFFTYTIDK